MSRELIKAKIVDLVALYNELLVDKSALGMMRRLKVHLEIKSLKERLEAFKANLS